MNKTVKNPAIGHHITFLQTGAETGGELLQIEYGVLQPETEPAIPLHIHLECSERFEVVQGQLGVILDGERRLLGVGEQVHIPPGTPHTFWNAGNGELRFITDVRPPGQLQTYWETVFGLAEDGKVGRNGLPNLLQLAVVAPLADSYFPGVPVWLTKGFTAVLGAIGRLVGYKASYPKYSG
ncbi:cupin domain-containing protein [Candidatus Leptofilum sp.]|uniref:cupin domain-containing protein n=1 Tax=Candidatus Leptofilum sp. TaxID=3241576 RepID=UPI003B5AB918